MQSSYVVESTNSSSRSGAGRVPLKRHELVGVLAEDVLLAAERGIRLELHALVGLNPILRDREVLQALAREIASPAEMLFCFLRQSFGSRIPGGFQLHDHSSESLRERVVNVAGHAITFCRDGRLAALL